MKVRDRSGGAQGRYRLQMEGAETPTPSSDKQFLGRRYPPQSLGTRIAIPDGTLLGPPPSCLTPSRQTVLWGWVPHQTGFWAQSMTHRGHGALCPFLTSIPAGLMPGPSGCARQFLCAPLSPPSWKWSQPSPLCPAMEAEPACFWLPYMNH